MSDEQLEVDRLAAGIPGFDDISGGGLPGNRLSLVAGTAGSGKTIFTVQFLADGIARGESAVFVTFEERPSAVRRNFRAFGWDIEAWEREDRWAFVDGSPNPEGEPLIQGDFDLASLVVRVRHAVERTGAKRVGIDATGSLVDQFDDVRTARRALLEISIALENLGVTSVITAERAEEYGPVSRHGFEEYIADNVVVLRNALDGSSRRRTVEVLKLRGGTHRRGEHLFTIASQRGMVVVPQEAFSFDYPSSRRRLSCGIGGLDEMLHGGLYDKSLTLVSGPTGVGKSLLTTEFVAGVADGEKAILFSFEESRDQHLRNAEGWGIDLERLEGEGRVKIIARAPESASLEEHLLQIKAEIAAFDADRIAVDSLTALERVATAEAFHQYLLGLSFHIKSRAKVALVTATADNLGSGFSTGTLHLSTVADTVLLQVYVLRDSEIRRSVTVLKHRGSDHDKAVREYRIGDSGMAVLEPLAVSAFGDLPVAP